MDLIRQSLAKSRLVDVITNENLIDDINNYFEHKDDHDKIKNAIKKRFGVGITTETDPANPDAPYKLYSRGEFTQQVDAGLIEAISIGWGQKVIAALATLFTEKGQRIELDCDGEKDTSDLLKFLEDKNEKWGYDSAIIDVDKKSVQTGAAVMFVQAKNDKLEYNALTPADLRVYWPETIIDNGQPRSPDYSNIEDAYAITIRLSMLDNGQYSYLAIFGRSEDWPDGRWVEYTSTSQSRELPGLGDDGTSEYIINGKPANPLSYWKNLNEEHEEVPEYPISVIYGDNKSRSTPFPFYSSLYEDDIEFTMTAAHILSKSNDAAGGVTVVEVDETGEGKPLPVTLSGAVSTLAGQKIEHISKSASDCKTAMETVNMLMVSTAAGWSVPDYMVVSEDYALEASSGIALQVKTRPLMKKRQWREKLNAESVAKIFNIQKALLDLHFDFAESKQLLNCNLVWTAGPLELPENKKEKVDRISTLMDKGIFDIIAAIREWYNYNTDAEAIQEYEEMKARKEKYPSLTEEPKKQAGLFRNNLNGR